MLPVAALVLALFGLSQVVGGIPAGWWYVAGGGVLLIADILIDFVWAHPSVLRTDQPELNRPSAQLVGRLAVVEDAIVHGRGKVRIGDMIWTAEGPDMPAGSQVRVTAAEGSVLRVARA